MNIGKNLYIGVGTIIWAEDLCLIEIGNNVTIGNNVKIISRRGITVGEDAIIKDGTIITGKKKVCIGNSSYLGRNMFIDCTEEVLIGDNVFMSFSKIFTHNYSYSSFVKGLPVPENKVIIGSNTWIGPDSYIVPGIVISDNSYIGPKTLLSTNTKPFIFYSGNPGRGILSIKDKIEELSRSVNVFDNISNVFKDFPTYKKSSSRFIFKDDICKVFQLGKVTVLLIYNIRDDEINSIISLKKKHEKIVIIGNFDGNHNSTKEYLTKMKKNKITLFNLKSNTYFPLNFSRFSIIWEIKMKLRTIGIFFSNHN